jgi:hypothetical protein
MFLMGGDGYDDTQRYRGVWDGRGKDLLQVPRRGGQAGCPLPLLVCFDINESEALISD